MKHLLVTNDFPPKAGGIQRYLWEHWRRLPPAGFGVATARQPVGPRYSTRKPSTARAVPVSFVVPPKTCGFEGCGSHAAVSRWLSHNFTETPLARGLQGDGRLYEL